MDFDTLVLIAYLAATIALIGVLGQKGLARRFPFFTAFLLFELAMGFGFFAVMQFRPLWYRAVYLVSILIEAGLEFTVLAEVGRSVARFNRASPPHPALIGLLLGLAGLPLCTLVQWQTPAGVAPLLTDIARSQQVISLLRVAAILALAFWSSIRRFRWPEDQFRIATGVAFYSIVAFAVIAMEARVSWPVYRSLSRISVVGYLIAILYWLIGFSRSRREDQGRTQWDDDRRLPTRSDDQDRGFESGDSRLQSCPVPIPSRQGGTLQ